MRKKSLVKGNVMRPVTFKPLIFWSRALLVCVALLLAGTTLANAQEGGIDVGGGASIFRPRNPETTSKRRTNRARTGTGGGGRTGARTGAGRGAANAAAAAELEERVEDLLDEGNEARDERKYA